MAYFFTWPLKLQPRQGISLSYSMRIRNYTPADLDALRRLHAAQGFGYPFPDLESPLFVSKLVLEDNESETGFSRSPFHHGPAPNHNEEAADGREAVPTREGPHPNSPPEKADAGSPRIVMAVLLRLTAEAYLLHDASAGTPRQRWQRLLALHDAARHDAAARGLDDVQAFLPPRIARAFGRRLAQLGWRRDPWPCFSRVTRG
jgi:hypothetical protein